MTIVAADLEKLRYPVGKFSFPDRVYEADIEKWIHTIEKFPSKLRAEVEHLTDAQLDTPYRDGGWTVRQVVHHLADSHLNSYMRFKLALTEEHPTIRPYDEKRWAELPEAKHGPVEVSVNLLESLHVRWVLMMRGMNAADFIRTYYHPENKQTRSLQWTLGLYEWHCRHHLGHITSLKKRMGW